MTAVGMALLMLLACAAAQAAPADGAVSPIAKLEAERDERLREVSRLAHRQAQWVEERELFETAARAAWAYVSRRFVPATGLVPPVPSYPIATIWDIASMLAAVHAARGLGFIDDAAYAGRIDGMLATLARIPLYDGRVFSRAYDTRTGGMVPYSGVQTAGWSATDLGRLLIWLRVVGADPRFAKQAEAIVRRIDLAAVVRDDYLWGADIDGTFASEFTYQEGRIGYEQYAAQGFALWGHRAEKALRLTENALPTTVMGQTLPADRRRWDRLTSEPFVLLGLELGWDRQTARLARRLLAAQEARYRRTGLVTVASEDAIAVPPHYFYYYCVLAGAKHFGIDVQSRRGAVDGPRWVSAKSAFALHVLLPSRYTHAAIAAVQPARGPSDWGAGVYESSGGPTGTPNINTAAVILEAALVHRAGEPLLPRARRAHNPRGEA